MRMSSKNESLAEFWSFFDVSEINLFLSTWFRSLKHLKAASVRTEIGFFKYISFPYYIFLKGKVQLTINHVHLTHIQWFGLNRHQNRHIALYNPYRELEDVKSEASSRGSNPRPCDPPFMALLTSWRPNERLGNTSFRNFAIFVKIRNLLNWTMKKISELVILMGVSFLLFCGDWLKSSRLCFSESNDFLLLRRKFRPLWNLNKKLSG